MAQNPRINLIALIKQIRQIIQTILMLVKNYYKITLVLNNIQMITIKMHKQTKLTKIVLNYKIVKR
jgi:hypothetical protein